ncbi:cobyric acid synthase, partial [Desulfovibrio oxamicus]
MVQGTCSNAGKSILAAAFCRIFLQDGLRVAPFKAQNMALNSCVTSDGLEMGRAQAVQAAACRLDPDVRMNPVLLKPCSDVGSQVIVMGRPVGVMRVRQYVDYKPRARDAAFAAYDSLAAEHDVMVIEGAGSPAEINLKAHDIVNMAMARHAGARVLLVGDIDRGGVFAALVGTMELLEDWERNHVAGYLLNKFRGDASLLDPALDFMKQRTGRPVLGVVPYLRDLGLPEEDSVSFKEGLPGLRGLRDGAAGEGGVVPDTLPAIVLDIVLVDLPHISNFTDVDALRGEPDVRLRVARTPADLPAPGGRMP